MPAYKPDFLRQALDCLVAQTCHDFTVYVGDDCSPHGLEAIVATYSSQLDLHYTRFADNLGSRDLISQWERCVALANGGERWLWFFSDDDRMDPQCVERFFAEQQTHPQVRLFHFDVTVIEADGQPTTDHRYIKPDFPAWLSAHDFLRQRLGYKLNSFVVEYIMERQLFDEAGGFVRYPLAWCSDDATWHRLALRAGGIRTIPEARVQWRKSQSNITPDLSPATQRLKLQAVHLHLGYCLHQLGITSLPAVARYYLHALYQARSIFGL